jgi:hypothetical protein
MQAEIFSHILQNTFTQKQQAVRILININASVFSAQNKTISQIHRQITNSKQILGGITNRQLWKELFNGGYYIYNQNTDGVKIEYFLDCRIGILTEHQARHLKGVIKKVIWSDVLVENIDPPQNLSLTSSGFRLVGEWHRQKLEFEYI